VKQVVGLDLSPRMVEWATGSNAFFSLTVRIQKERGQAVVEGGPYRFVRHPSYVGAILFVVRTAIEDRTLQKELDDYTAYAERTRYRLLPGVW
jgi:protein-S-isoprenylcysteine O-methyltransferase Ste14